MTPQILVYRFGAVDVVTWFSHLRMLNPHIRWFDGSCAVATALTAVHSCLLNAIWTGRRTACGHFERLWHCLSGPLAVAAESTELSASRVEIADLPALLPVQSAAVQSCGLRFEFLRQLQVTVSCHYKRLVDAEARFRFTHNGDAPSPSPVAAFLVFWSPWLSVRSHHVLLNDTAWRFGYDVH